MWDFSSTNAFGPHETAVAGASCSSSFCAYERALNQIDCSETYATRIAPATFKDVSGGLGAAVMMGPRCKTDLQKDWDVNVTDVTLSVLNFVVNNGEHEAIQFDGALNDGLYVSTNIDDIVDPAQGASLPRDAIAIEMWFTIERSNVQVRATHIKVSNRDTGIWSQFAGLMGAQQDGISCQKGWSLAYSTIDDSSGGTTTVAFKISLEANQEDGSGDVLSGPGP
eukprot:370464-Rhodomonas_salina.1